MICLKKSFEFVSIFQTQLTSNFIPDASPQLIIEHSNNAMYFTNEQFVVGLQFPLPSLVRQFMHYSQVSLAYIHPNVIRILMRLNVFNMVYCLELSLSEILLTYTIKMNQCERFLLLAHTLSLQIVTSLHNSSKEWEKRYVIVFRLWSGSSDRLDHEFCLNYILNFQVQFFTALTFFNYAHE